MLFRLLPALLINAIVFSLAFDQIFGQVSQEMIEQGRTQYQLLREKSNLPQYGTCWKAALDYVDEGCKNLSEETQSDIALHLANCFLAMSGHETYNCELNRKPNLRAICISSMSDRAFNVYTKFFTHTQNICWFLRGQIWQETISENAFKVGKQLEETARHQQDLIAAQKQSLEAQQKILQHGKMLESVLEDLYISTKAHQEILRLLTKSFANFQAWAVGELSWLDSILFYTVSGAFVLLLTTLKQTHSARLPLFLFMFSNLLLERILCYWLIGDTDQIGALYADLYSLIWYCRNCFILIEFAYLIYFACTYKDLTLENHKYIVGINEQNGRILEILTSIRASLTYSNRDSLRLIDESFSADKEDCNESNSSGFSEIKHNFRLKQASRSSRYNLRSKQNTPELLHL